MILPLLLQAVFGVADPAQRFSPVPTPSTWSDPCGDRGPAARWVKMSDAGAPASIHSQGWLDSATLWTGARMIVALRRNDTWSGTVFDPCANAWSPMADTRDLARGAAWQQTGQEDRPFVPSHAKSSWDEFDKMRVWDSGRKAWVIVQAAQLLTPRAHYAVVHTGRRLLVWGGWAPNVGALGDGAVLDIARHSWKKMSAAGAPSPRLEPTAVVWTGSRLLVWGGRFQGAVGSTAARTLGDGAQYDPATDRWTPMSAVGAPSVRTDAAVAWTGKKLVVVGGATQMGGPPSTDGGVYDPATDRWTHLEAPPDGIVLPKRNVGPLIRILIGPDGRVVFLPEQLGAIAVLDADAARWTSIAADGPGKRNSFRAFLLGRRLIVWGGQTLIAEHICPPPVPGQPICDSFAESAPRNDGWMILLPR